MQNDYSTPLNGRIALCRDFLENEELQRDKSLYKFLWVRSGKSVLSVDSLPETVEADEIAALSPFQRVEMKSISGEYVMLLFNSNFYCIFGHDSEVSCNGLLFHGGSQIEKIRLDEEGSSALSQIVVNIEKEYANTDSLQEEMLRILLKRFIITCTRIARESHGIKGDNEKSYDLIRLYRVLVDINFREKKLVRDYADMLNRSPKTLSNLFSNNNQPSPLQIIHERILTEAKRYLLYSDKSAKEIADMLQFDDLPAFSRFFRGKAGLSISEFRKENRPIGNNR